MGRGDILGRQQVPSVSTVLKLVIFNGPCYSRVWTVVNKQDSIKAGQMFSVRLLITFPTSPNPPNLLSATLDGQDVCMRESTATTMPSTMSSTTTMLSTPKTTVSNMMGQNCGIFKIDAGMI